MNITSKSRYALKIMMDLASHQESLTHRGDIASRQGIPLEYMDQILLRLKEHRIIESTRGRSGGYRLSRPPEEITTFEIFKAVEDGFALVQCLETGSGCYAEHFCQAKDAWSTISNALRDSLSGILLAKLVADRSEQVAHGTDSQTEISKIPTRVDPENVLSSDPGAWGAGATWGAGAQECRAPRRSPPSHSSLKELTKK